MGRSPPGFPLLWSPPGQNWLSLSIRVLVLQSPKKEQILDRVLPCSRSLRRRSCSTMSTGLERFWVGSCLRLAAGGNTLANLLEKIREGEAEERSRWEGAGGRYG